MSWNGVKDAAKERQLDRWVVLSLTGVGTGLALGVVFAPQSGEESRRMIQKKAQSGKDLVKTTVDQGQEYIKRQGNELLDKANELIDQGKNAVKQKKDQLGAAAEAGNEAYRSSVEEEETLRTTTQENGT